jgi:phenylalanyl-tRNA synthetase beta chain
VVGVPSYRATKDVEFEADIIEEVGRMIGYDNIPISSPRLDIAPVQLSVAQKLYKKLRDYLIYRQYCYELMSYPLVGAKLFKKMQWNHSNDLKLVNALSSDAEFMRPSLIPQALQTVVQNQKNFEQFRFFELGRSYLPNSNDFAEEQSHLLIGFYAKNENQFMALLDSVDQLIKYLGIPANIVDRHPKFKATLVDEQWPGLHPYEFKNIQLMGKMEGNIFSVHPYLLKQLKIKGHLSFMVLNLSPLERKAIKEKINYTALAKFPSSTFDWTVEMRAGQAVGDLFKALNKVKLKELTSLHIVDEFVRDDVTFLTLSATFLDREKTLSSDFLQSAKERLIEASNKAGFPLKL